MLARSPFFMTVIFEISSLTKVVEGVSVDLFQLESSGCLKLTVTNEQGKELRVGQTCAVTIQPLTNS